MVLNSESAHRGPHGSFNGQAVRSMILARTTELGTSRKRALWTAISSPLIHDLFKSTRLAVWTTVGVGGFEPPTSRTRTVVLYNFSSEFLVCKLS